MESFNQQLLSKEYSQDSNQHSKKQQIEGQITLENLCYGQSQVTFQCQQCKKTYKKKNKLSRHIRQTHQNLTPFKCQICQKSFKRIQHLQRHQSCHSNEKPIACFECTCTFKNQQQMTRHYKSVHLSQLKKVIKCDKCDETFLKKRSLKKHQKQHLEKTESIKLGKKIQKQKRKVHICNINDCGKAFDSHYALKRHFTKIHRYTESIFQVQELNQFDCQDKQLPLSSQQKSSLKEMIEGLEMSLELYQQYQLDQNQMIFQESEERIINC